MIKVKVNLAGLSGLKDFSIDGIMRTIATSMLGEMSTRIYENGQASDGGEIGQYNATNPLYVNPKNSPVSFQPAGKREATYSIKTKKASSSTVRTTKTVNLATKKEVNTSIRGNNKERTTKWFASYKNFREEVNRPTDRVNLSLTGTMNNQCQVIATEGGYGLGWSNPDYYKRATGFQTKYGKPIWDVTESESAMITEIANQGIKDALS
jgi:hypothetical protein